MTMRSKQHDVAKSNNSSVLFLTADGEPMSFFLRPGPVKRKLQPLILSGGGMMCSVQQPGAILLIDQEDRGSIPETAAHWYVSINYIHDCIEKGKHLNVEDYRLNPDDIPRHSARLVNKKASSGLTGGRSPYSPEEDAAILSYVSKHRSETGGNRLWQEMQKQHVTGHSWQSMKNRFRVTLAKKLSDAEGVKTTEEETKTEVPKSSSGNAASHQTHSPQPEAPQTDLTQIDDQPVPAASSQPEDVEAETSNVSQPEEPRVDAQEDAPVPADGTEPEAAETQVNISPQTENVPEDFPFSSSTPQEQSEKQRASSKQEERPQRRPTRRQLEASPSSREPYGKKLRSPYSAEKLSSSPQSARKTTTDSPPSKRARRLSVSAESEELESIEIVVSETPQPEEESNSVENAQKRTGKRKFGILESATKEFEDESESSEDDAADLQNPPEKAAIPTTSAGPPLQPSDWTADLVSAQSQRSAALQEEAQQTQAVSSDSAPEKGRSEPAPAASGPAASDPSASGTPASGPAASDPSSSDPSASGPAASGSAASDPAASGFAASNPSASDPSASSPAASGPAASSPEASGPAASGPAASGPSACDPAASGPGASDPGSSGPGPSGPAASGPAACDLAASGPAACDLAASGPAATEALHAASRAHLFIFDSESQEEDSQPLTGDNATALSNPQPLVRKAPAPSLTQLQVEEDMKQLSALMNQTNQDIVNVTKALLRTSGDVSAALDLLLNPSTICGPVWNRSDDGLLISADPVVRQQLEEKYGEKEFAKRIVFLELEG